MSRVTKDFKKIIHECYVDVLDRDKVSRILSWIQDGASGRIEVDNQGNQYMMKPEQECVQFFLKYMIPDLKEVYSTSAWKGQLKTPDQRVEYAHSVLQDFINGEVSKQTLDASLDAVKGYQEVAIVPGIEERIALLESAAGKTA